MPWKRTDRSCERGHLDPEPTDFTASRFHTIYTFPHDPPVIQGSLPPWGLAGLSLAPAERGLHLSRTDYELHKAGSVPSFPGSRCLAPSLHAAGTSINNLCLRNECPQMHPMDMTGSTVHLCSGRILPCFSNTGLHMPATSLTLTRMQTPCISHQKCSLEVTGVLHVYTYAPVYTYM